MKENPKKYETGIYTKIITKMNDSEEKNNNSNNPKSVISEKDRNLSEPGKRYKRLLEEKNAFLTDNLPRTRDLYQEVEMSEYIILPVNRIILIWDPLTPEPAIKLAKKVLKSRKASKSEKNRTIDKIKRFSEKIKNKD